MTDFDLSTMPLIMAAGNDNVIQFGPLRFQSLIRFEFIQIIDECFTHLAVMSTH